MAQTTRSLAITVMIFMCSQVAGGGGAWAQVSFSEPTKEEILRLNVGSGLTRIPTLFEYHFEKTMNEKPLFLAFFYSDPFSAVQSSPQDAWWIQEDLENEGRYLARRALMSALGRAVDDFQTVHRYREYGKSISRADLTVNEGEMTFAGPSLENAGRTSDHSNPADDLRSTLSVTNGFDLGLNWKTTSGPYRFLVTYFLTGKDDFGLTLDRALAFKTDLSLTYRLAPSESTSLATLNLRF